jgi:hypothetical protein
MISKLIQEKVEERFGQPIRYAKDCEVLSVSIYAFTKQKVSCSTLKRLFGIIESNNEPRLYTLDILANYLGYMNYDQLLQEFNPGHASKNESVEALNAKDLRVGEIVRIRYTPNLSILLECVSEFNFSVIESNEPKIPLNGSLMFISIVRDSPLFASLKTSSIISAKNIVLGKISGITSIERL